jgi:hypothetical protein
MIRKERRALELDTIAITQDLVGKRDTGAASIGQTLQYQN